MQWLWDVSNTTNAPWIFSISYGDDVSLSCTLTVSVCLLLFGHVPSMADRVLLGRLLLYVDLPDVAAEFTQSPLPLTGAHR